MALALSGPALPDATVNDCLDELVTKIQSVSELAGVQGYRSMLVELESSAAVTSIAAVMGDSPVGLSMAYDYIVDVIVKIDNDYEAAERKLNAICDGIWRAVWGAHHPHWSNCFPYAADQKPASPQELVNWRRAILYVRVIPI